MPIIYKFTLGMAGFALISQKEKKNGSLKGILKRAFDVITSFEKAAF